MAGCRAAGSGRAERRVVAAQLGAGDRHLVHLVGAVGEAQGADARRTVRASGSRGSTPPRRAPGSPGRATLQRHRRGGDLDRRRSRRARRLLPTVSISHAVFSVSSRTISSSMRASAIQSWMFERCGDRLAERDAPERPPAHQVERPARRRRSRACSGGCGPGRGGPGRSRTRRPRSPSRLVGRHPHVVEADLGVALVVDGSRTR